MNPLQVVLDAIEKGQKERAIQAHNLLLNKANHFASAIAKNSKASEKLHHDGYVAASELFEAATALQMHGIEVAKFPKT